MAGNCFPCTANIPGKDRCDSDGTCAFDNLSFFPVGVTDCPGDLLLIDLDGLNRFFLRSLLPIVRDTLPKVPVIGISTKSSYTLLDNELKLDACFNEVPRLEDLVVLTPQVTAKYLVDTGTPRAIGNSPPL